MKMKARNRKDAIHQHDLSPHLSTATSRKEGPKKSSSHRNPSSSSSSSLSFSFGSLSLKQGTAATVTPPSPGRTATVEDMHSTTNTTTSSQNAGPRPRPRSRPISADLDIFSPQCPTTSTTSDSEVPKGLMIRKVSLEPRTQFASSTSKTRETTIGTYTDKNLTCYVQHKRSRHLSCPDSLTCDELVSQTQKRRRLAKRNKALTSTDFDSILGSLDVGCISGV